MLVVLEDDPEERREVMRYASDLGLFCRASLLPVYPAELPQPIVQGFPIGSPLLTLSAGPSEIQRARGQQIMDETLAQIQSFGAKADCGVVSGASRALEPESASAAQCDLVVVPRLKKRSLDRILRGDTAVEIVGGSPRPVVVVKCPPWKKKRLPGEGGRREDQENGS